MPHYPWPGSPALPHPVNSGVAIWSCIWQNYRCTSVYRAC